MVEDTLLAVDNLSLSFPTFTGFVKVLHDVSFTVKKGETLAIVGESGSGKTVTMRRVMHLLKKVHTDGGSIRLRKRNGSIRDITNLRNSEARQIRGVDMSMIFQEPMTSLNPLFTIGNQLAEALLTRHLERGYRLFHHAHRHIYHYRLEPQFSRPGRATADPRMGGAMLAESRDYIGVADHMSIYPGIAIFLTVLFFNLFGDGLRAALDPKTK